MPPIAAALAIATAGGALVLTGRLRAQDAERAAARRVDREFPEDAALSGGEDYELLVAVPPTAALRLGPGPVLAGVRLTEIGEVTEGKTGVFLCREGGKTRLDEQGFRHF